MDFNKIGDRLIQKPDIKLFKIAYKLIIELSLSCIIW